MSKTFSKAERDLIMSWLEIVESEAAFSGLGHDAYLVQDLRDLVEERTALLVEERTN